MKTKPTGYWTFFCNPQRWNIDDFLATKPETPIYLITEWQKDMFRKGDKGLIRVSIDRRMDRKILLEAGIYALVEIISLPHMRGSFQMEFWNEPKPVIFDRLCVDLKIVYNLIDRPVLISELNNNQEVDDKYLLNGGYGFYSSMPLMKSSYEIVTMMAESAA